MFSRRGAIRQLPRPMEHIRDSNLRISRFRTRRCHCRGSPKPAQSHSSCYQIDILAHPVLLRPLRSAHRHSRPLQLQTPLFRYQTANRSVRFSFRSSHHRKRYQCSSWLYERLYPHFRLLVSQFRSLCCHPCALLLSQGRTFASYLRTYRCPRRTNICPGSVLSDHLYRLPECDRWFKSRLWLLRQLSDHVWIADLDFHPRQPHLLRAC